MLDTDCDQHWATFLEQQKDPLSVAASAVPGYTWEEPSCVSGWLPAVPILGQVSKGSKHLDICLYLLAALWLSHWKASSFTGIVWGRLSESPGVGAMVITRLIWNLVLVLGLWPLCKCLRITQGQLPPTWGLYFFAVLCGLRSHQVGANRVHQAKTVLRFVNVEGRLCTGTVVSVDQEERSASS